MQEVNWTVLTYFVIGIFALNGLYKGWWREALTTVALAFLVFLLGNPDWAEWLINIINSILATIWGWLPNSVVNIIQDILQNGLGIQTGGGSPQIDPGNGGNWLMIMLFFILLAAIVARLTLPGHVGRSTKYTYVASPMGNFLGIIIGGLNGWLVINLVKEYLNGSNLPGGPPTEVSMSGNAAMASPGVSFRAAEVPTFTLMDGIMPWIVVGLGVLFLLFILYNRWVFSYNKGFVKLNSRDPMGYVRREF